MCDYSLMMVPNRLAVEGEELVAHRFQSGSTGLVARRDFDFWTSRRPKTFWQWLRDGFFLVSEPTPVVCIPPGARLRLNKTSGAPDSMDGSQEAVFKQISEESNQYRDALCFANGTTVLVQELPEGQKLRVLWLSSSEDFVPTGGWPEFVRAA